MTTMLLNACQALEVIQWAIFQPLPGTPDGSEAKSNDDG